MIHRRKPASLGQLPLDAFACVQLCGRREKAPGVGGRAQEIGGFLQGFVVFEREHHHGRRAVAGDDQGFVIVANSIHRAGEIGADGGVGHGIHDCSPNIYAILYLAGAGGEARRVISLRRANRREVKHYVGNL